MDAHAGERCARRWRASKLFFDPECPDTAFTLEKFRQLRPVIIEELEWASDRQTPAAAKQPEKGGTQIELRVSDGEQATHYSRYAWCNREQYAYLDNPKQFFGDNFFIELSYFRLGWHSFWWNSRVLRDRREKDLCLGKRPEDYLVIGKRSYRGRDCYTLESEDGKYQLIVDVRYERLRGNHFVQRAPPRRP